MSEDEVVDAKAAFHGQVLRQQDERLISEGVEPAALARAHLQRGLQLLVDHPSDEAMTATCDHLLKLASEFGLQIAAIKDGKTKQRLALGSERG